MANQSKRGPGLAGPSRGARGHRRPEGPDGPPDPIAGYERLQRIFREMGSVLVAYSGGIDSTLLAKAACETLGDRSIAVTAVSPTIPPHEVAEAKRIAGEIGIRHLLVESREMDRPDFLANDLRRCYFCKTELFDRLFEIAQAEKLDVLVYGVTLDDLGDYRPGMEAARERGVRSPLVEAALTKSLVREIGRNIGLSNWDKPSAACLSSRFPYGTGITEERLSLVGKAENFLRELGFRQFRVRYIESKSGDETVKTARIEVDPEEIPRFADPKTRETIVHAFRHMGFTYVTLDLQGYRTGSLNESLNPLFRL